MKGTTLGVDFEKGEFILKSQFSGYDEDAELTELERQAVEIIKSAFESDDILFNRISFQRRTTNYLTLVIDKKYSNDFCRIKVGPQSTWLSLDMWSARVLREDARFSDVKNKNQRHWKVNLSCIEDFEKVTDLIVATYKAIVSPTDLNFVPKTESLNINFTLSNRKSLHKTGGMKMLYDENGKIIKGQNLIDTETYPSDFVLFDFETTGYDVGSKIVEIAAVKVRGDKIIDCFEKLVNPQTSISKMATKEHGITDEMVADKPILDNVIGGFVQFIDKDILIGHNINRYDYNILSKECYRILGKNIRNDFLDTLSLAQRLIDKDVVGNYKLNTLCYYFDIKEKPNHRALQDVKANFELYKILKTLPNKKITKSKSLKKVSKSQNAEKKTCQSFKCAFDVTGKRICLTGEFACATRSDVERQLKQLGAKVTNNLSSKTEYLLIGDLGTKTTHKINDAKALNIEIIYEKDFLKIEVLENV